MGDPTSDLDDAFFSKLEEVASQLEANPLDMLGVMYSESGCRADAHNDNPKNLPPEQRYNASGLIQFMPATLKALGFLSGHAAFRRLSATAQLSYVRAYYRPYVGFLNSVGGLYVATFLPALVKHAGDPTFVLTAKNGPLGWAYAPNAAFDVNLDLAITVAELEAAVRRNCRGARWMRIIERLRGTSEVEEPERVLEIPIDLRTTTGIQQALRKLGLEPGPVDGIVGPKTRSAVSRFQQMRQLHLDGVVGPLTRAALEEALAHT